MKASLRNTRHWRAPLVLVGVTALLTGPVGAGPATAQESGTSDTWTPREKARIGVFLEERCDDRERAENHCDLAPLVTSVVVDGPADQAGIQALDTLLTVDGLDVTTRRGREALLDLTAGVSVELELGRATGHVKVNVVPEIRSPEPYVEVRTRFLGPGFEAPAAGMEAHEVHVARLPAVRGRLEEVEVRLDSLRRLGSEFVFFHTDEDGRFRIDVGDPETAGVILERIRRLENDLSSRHPDVRQAPGQERATDRVGEVRVDVDLPRYVWENEELAKRLTVVRDSSLRSARVHLDSLVRLYGRVRLLPPDSLGRAVTFQTRVDPRDGWWAYQAGPQAVPVRLRRLLVSNSRVAGAEFQPLSRDLAQYFDGVERGLLVLRVIDDTPAARAGLRGGDVIIQVDGRTCSDVRTLRDALAGPAADAGIVVKWIRKGTELQGRLEPD